MLLFSVKLERYWSEADPNGEQIFVESVKEFKCITNGCNKSFRTRPALTRHLSSICGRPPRNKCPYCNFVSRFSRAMNGHISKNHPDPAIERGEFLGILVDPSGLFVCPNKPACNKVFETNTSLTQHIRYCLNPDKRFKCGYCGHESKRRGDIKRHIQFVHPAMPATVYDSYRKLFR